jgi:hypothetical protein
VDASLDTVRGWTFQPASLDGSPAGSKAYVVIAFREPITVPTTTPSDTGTDTTTTDTGS